MNLLQNLTDFPALFFAKVAYLKQRYNFHDTLVSFAERQNITMEYFSNDDNQMVNRIKPAPNVFALFAKSLGVFSIFCAVFSIFIGSFICGGLAIILAILSKGYSANMEKNAKIGLVTGTIGIVLQLSVLTVSVYNIIHIPEFREQFNSLYEQMYGEPVDDSINEILDQLGLPNEKGEIL